MKYKLIMEGWRDYLKNLGNQDLADATPIDSDEYRAHTQQKRKPIRRVVTYDRDFKTIPLKSFEIEVLGRDDDAGLNARAELIAVLNDAFRDQDFANALEAVKQIDAQDPAIFDMMDEQSQDGADLRAQLVQKALQGSGGDIDIRSKRAPAQQPARLPAMVSSPKEP